MDTDRWWWSSDYGRENRLREGIEDLEASVGGVYRETSRLRSQLASLQGSLQSKVDRLAAAFDAFVELSDVRVEMAMYAEAAVVRHRVRLMLGAINAGDTLVPPELPDVPGYWLVPAARALHAHLNGDRESAVRLTEAATELDARRSRYFLIAGARLAGPVDLTAVELAALLPDVRRPEVDRATRSFWRATAAGAFGDAGKGVLSTALATALGRPGGEDSAGIAPWLQSIAGPASGAAQPQAVAITLESLRNRCQRTDPGVPAGPGKPDATSDPATGPLTEVIRSLVDEGHDPERELLRRGERLRGLVETGTAPPPYRGWDEPLGSVGDLVREDIFAESEASPGIRPIAVRAAAPWLLAASERIALGASPTGTAKVRVRGRDIAIGPQGADPTAVAEARQHLATEYPPTRTRLYAGIGVAVVGLAVAVAGFAAVGAWLGILGLIALAVGGVLAIVGWRESDQRVTYGRTERDAMDRAVAREVEQFQRRHASEARQLERIAAERAALSELLA